jgi:polyisoprenoid-binding protein YceI
MSLIKLSSFIFAGLMAGSLVFTSCSQAPKSDEAKVQDSAAVTAPASTALTFSVDTTASKISWIGTKPTGKHNGTFSVATGTLSAENGALTGGSFEINIASLKVLDLTDAKKNADLAGHLKSKDFFEAEKFPTAKFEISAVAPYQAAADSSAKEENSLKIADPTHLISGNLTLKGVTKNITFPAKVTVDAAGVTAVANFNIDRTQWAIVYNAEGPGSVKDKVIHNKVNLGIELKATAAPAK